MRLSIATAAMAFSASAFAALADDPMGMAMPAAASSPAAAAAPAASPAAADDAPADDAAPAGGLPGLPGIDISAISGLIPKPTEEQKAKAKKVFQYFYPDCAQPCAAAAMTASGFDMTKKNPSALCRSSFSDSFLTCAKSKCTEMQLDRMKVSLRRVCYLNTPQCALGCAFPLPEGGLSLEGLGSLGLPGGGPAADADTGDSRRRRVRRDDAPASDAAPADGAATSPARPACGPFDFACTCKDDYAKWYTSCLTTSCPNKEDVNHELATGLAICNAIPPSCTKSCTKDAMTKANCNALEDPECTCSPKVESAFMDCLTTIDCPLSDKAKAISGFNNNCEFTKALLDGLPRIPSALEEMGLPVPPGIPTSVASLKDAFGAAQEAIAGLAGQLTGDSGDKDDDERKKMRIVKAIAAVLADKPTPTQ